MIETIKQQQDEIWRPVLGWEQSYLISSLGNVFSVRRGKPVIGHDGKGYRRITLYESGRKKTVKIHRLVMDAFVGPSDLHVDHLNGDKSDNNLLNLQYVTNRENAIRYSASKKRSLPTGVYFDKSKNRYRATIFLNGKTVALGSFSCPVVAGKAYEAALSNKIIARHTPQQKTR